MRRNELLTTTAVAPEATASSAAPIATTTEPETISDSAPPPAQTDNVSIYRFGKAVYKVRTHFNLECTETLADVVGRLILQDLNDTEN